MLPHDPTHLYVEHTLLRLLAELPPGWPVAPIVVTQTLRDLGASLRIGPADQPLVTNEKRPLTAAEQEILEGVLFEIERLGRRVSGAEIRATLKEAGIRWGISTINRVLADLVAKGHLVNARDGTGYGRGLVAG